MIFVAYRVLLEVEFVTFKNVQKQHGLVVEEIGVS